MARRTQLADLVAEDFLERVAEGFREGMIDAQHARLAISDDDRLADLREHAAASRPSRSASRRRVTSESEATTASPPGRRRRQQARTDADPGRSPPG